MEIIKCFYFWRRRYRYTWASAGYFLPVFHSEHPLTRIGHQQARSSEVAPNHWMGNQERESMKITQTNKFRAADEVIPSVVGSIQSSGIPTRLLYTASPSIQSNFQVPNLAGWRQSFNNWNGNRETELKHKNKRKAGSTRRGHDERADTRTIILSLLFPAIHYTRHNNNTKSFIRK